MEEGSSEDNTGIANNYGAHKGVLELTAEGATAIYADKRIPLPAQNEGREAYLRAVIEVDSNNAELKKRLQDMLSPALKVPAMEGADENVAGHTSGPAEKKSADGVDAIPSPGTCQ